MAPPNNPIVIVMAPGLTACRVVNARPETSPRVFALPVTGRRRGELPEVARTRARHAARAVLQELLAEEFQRPLHAASLSDVRGQPVRALGWPQIGLSVSHEAEVVLVALLADGEVGVDIAAIDPAACADELQRTAALYLQPSEIAAPGDQASSPAAVLRVFLEAWTRQEARLKCVGQPLEEWSPSLESKVVDLRVSAVELPASICSTHVASVAWRSLV